MRFTQSPEPSAPVVMCNENWHFSMQILNHDPECLLHHKIKSKQCSVLRQHKKRKQTEAFEKEFNMTNQNKGF